ncbi:MAG: hypothetical protein U0637_09900 [Phycisphaerales bacterium]
MATVSAYDGFGNGPLNDLNGSNGGTGWTGPWMDVSSSQFSAVGGPGLSYPTMPTVPGSVHTDYLGDFGAAYYARSFPAPAGHVFLSFLLRPDAGGFGTNAGVSLGGGYNLIGAPLTLGNYGIRLGHYLFVDSGVPVVAGQAVLLVTEVEVVGVQTTYRLYINPALGQGKPATPNAQYTVGGSTIPSTLYMVSDGGFTTDELRVATTWEDAAPTTLGACCVSSSLCLSLSQANCAQIAGSTWGGANSTCGTGCAAPGCDTVDFNTDGLFPDTQDIDDYLSVFSGGACSTGACGDVDFNNDGLFPDTADIDSLLRVFSGGAC